MKNPPRGGEDKHDIAKEIYLDINLSIDWWGEFLTKEEIVSILREYADDFEKGES